MTGVDEAHQVYHWKHGWIPLNHAEANAARNAGGEIRTAPRADANPNHPANLPAHAGSTTRSSSDSEHQFQMNNPKSAGAVKVNDHSSALAGKTDAQLQDILKGLTPGTQTYKQVQDEITRRRFGAKSKESADYMVPALEDLLLENMDLSEADPELLEIVTSAAGAKGNEKLHAYWRHGEGAAKINWGVAGDFARCVSHLGKYIADPEGYCAKMHKDVTGATPGHAAGEAVVNEEENWDVLLEAGHVYHFKHGWIPLDHTDAGEAVAHHNSTKPSVGPSDPEKIANAEKMFGSGSKQHLAAQQRFAPKGAGSSHELAQATADLKQLESEWRFKKKAAGPSGPMSHDKIHYTQMIKDARARLKRAQGSKESADMDDTNLIFETVDLTERQATPSKSGRWQVVAISAGKGSSGYYSPQVLEAAAAQQLIAAGTPLFFDHPSESARTDRPERSVRDIAAVFTQPAQYDQRSQALVGEVQVFGPYRELVNEMAPHIGLSISGSATDVTEGPDGRVIEGLARIDSVDLVTKAGRGGQFVQLLESAREQMDHLHLYDDLKETDVPDDTTTDDITETSEGETPDETTTEQSPAEESTHTPSKEQNMTDVTEGAGGTAPPQSPPRNPREVMERQLAEQGRQISLLRAENVARDLVNEVLASGWIGEAQRARLTGSLLRDLPLTESGELDHNALKERAQRGLDEAETEAAEILQAAGVGTPRGLGALETPATEASAKQYEDSLRESFISRGMSAAAADLAVKGR